MDEQCWCGEMHEPHCPTCDKCGAPISTGLMAVICPEDEQCAFWPTDLGGQIFVRKMRKLSGVRPEKTVEGSP